MLQPPEEQYSDGAVLHRASQSGQWQQLQHDWEQQQQNHFAQLRHPHPTPSYYPPPTAPHSSTGYPDDPYAPFPQQSEAFPSAAPLILRIGLSASQSVDLPIDVDAFPPPDTADITRRFCAEHGITDEGRQRKLFAMIASSVQQHHDSAHHHNAAYHSVQPMQPSYDDFRSMAPSQAYYDPYSDPSHSYFDSAFPPNVRATPATSSRPSHPSGPHQPKPRL